MSGIPVTVLHPKTPVTSANWRDVSVGHVGDKAEREDWQVRADVCVTEAGAVNRVESGELVELSQGYECDFDPTPGEYEGQKYDGIQRNIEYNHLALLPKGCARGGPDMRLHLDDNEGEQVVMDNLLHMSEELKAEQDKVRAERDALKAANVQLQARCDAAEAASKPETVAARVKSLVKLREDARLVLGSEKPLPENDDEVMVAVITKRDPSFKAAELPYPLRARFDAEMAQFAKDGLRQVQEATRQDATPQADEDPVAKAAAEQAARNKDAWRIK